jgi:hypothetical protein
VKKIKPHNTTIITIPLKLGGISDVFMPKHAQVLGVSSDRYGPGGMALSVACAADMKNQEERSFVVLSAGSPIPHDEETLTLVGQPVADLGATWHVFEFNSPEGDARIPAKDKRGTVRVDNVQNGPVGGTSMQIGILGGGVAVDRGVMIQ